jgi:hypothetical protein
MNEKDFFRGVLDAEPGFDAIDVVELVVRLRQLAAAKQRTKAKLN